MVLYAQAQIGIFSTQKTGLQEMKDLRVSNRVSHEDRVAIDVAFALYIVPFSGDDIEITVDGYVLMVLRPPLLRLLAMSVTVTLQISVVWLNVVFNGISSDKSVRL